MKIFEEYDWQPFFYVAKSQESKENAKLLSNSSWEKNILRWDTSQNQIASCKQKHSQVIKNAVNAHLRKKN